MNKISAVIITYNEERNIDRCITSLLTIADEIVVLDSFSTDNTRSICEKYNVKFHTNPFQGYLEQKNCAMALASYTYILSLDADEVLSEPLQRSILALKNAEALYDGYSLNRLTNFCGSWIHHCGWYPDKRIRLWNRHKGHWGGVNPHDKVIMMKNATIGHLNGDLLHYSFESLSAHLKQIEKFTTIAAQEAFERKKVLPFIHIVAYPFFAFINMYIFKLGFLDGLPGFQVCIGGAYSKFIKYAKIKELKDKKSVKRIEVESRKV